MEPKKGYYRHFKGNIYQVLYIAKHSESLCDLVIYKSVKEDKIWARPLDMWFETVERDGKIMPRFSYIGEEYED
ncbi:MAG: DUF1653 domain-containing protein [Clostridia bacterium]|nr:DUF1653 domain-containing protein [Clostridia bacterium]